MTRLMVSNSQAFRLTRRVCGAVGWSLRHALPVCVVAGRFLISVSRLLAQSAATTVILISVMDGDRHPLADVTIEGRSGSVLLCKAVTMLMVSRRLAIAVLPHGFVLLRALQATSLLLPMFPCRIERPLRSHSPRQYSCNRPP